MAGDASEHDLTRLVDSKAETRVEKSADVDVGMDWDDCFVLLAAEVGVGGGATMGERVKALTPVERRRRVVTRSL